MESKPCRESLREGSSTQALVQAGPERNGVRVTPRAVKSAGRRFGPFRHRKVLGQHGWKAGLLTRKLAGKAIRRKASRVVPPFSLGEREDVLSFGGGRWDDPGQAGETGSMALKGSRGGSCRSAWNRRGGARGRQGDVRGRDDFGEGSPAVATRDQARGVRIQGVERRRRVAGSNVVSASSRGGWGE